MHALECLAKELTGQYYPCRMAVGKDVRHPDSRMVRVTSGQYWGTYGLSNWWEWREVKADGTLGPTECGYGW